MEIQFNVSTKYREIVENARFNKSSIVIENSTFTHAMFVSYHLIKSANKNVNIYTGGLNEIFYQDPIIINAIEDALKSGVMIKILVQEKIGDLPIKLKRIQTRYKSLFKIQFLKKNQRIKNHFLIVDKRGYRFEEEHNPKELDPYMVRGKVSFNDPLINGKLTDLFNYLWSSSY